MKDVRPILKRLWNSAVVWSWAFSALRLSTGVLLLPLLMRLSEADFGFYYVLLAIVAVVPLMDLGLLASIDRAIGYALSGADELKAQGTAAHAKPDAPPNFTLLWNLLHTTRKLYRLLALVVLVLLGGWGTYMVGLRVADTSYPRITWLAWGLTLLGGVFEMYSGWWNVYLRGLNRVVICSRILALAYMVKFLIAVGLLLGGFGLLSVPLAGFVSSFLQRGLSKHYVLQFLQPHATPPPSRETMKALWAALWPNSWRAGCQGLSSALTTIANTFLCAQFLGLGDTGKYGLSVQVATICQSMALVWIQVKWPLIYQLRSRNDLPGLRRIARFRLSAVSITYVCLAVLAVAIGQSMLDWLSQNSLIRERKALLPELWFVLLLVNIFGEIQFSTWAMFILAGNQMPFVRPTIITNVVSLVFVLVLLGLTDLGVGAFVIGPLAAGLAYNYWHWPREAAKSMETTVLRLLFRGAA